ncbi:MAG: CPBP family intramembrane metalloprotease [Cystobacterineae bacterium]|nr:CPBP family intramembrane metalloprotease [Cystobacterineae bacterium]
MRRSPLPQVAILGLLLFLVLSVVLQSLNFVFGAWFVQVFVFFCIPWVSLRLLRQPPSKALGLLSVSPKRLLAGGFLGMLCYVAVVLPLMYWVKQVVPASWEKMFDGRDMFSALSGIEYALMVGAVVLVAPLCEEVFFRGFIQPKLILRWGAPLGLLVSSVLFSLIHMDPVGFLARLALGLLFGWLAYVTSNLWVSVAAHASYNLLVYILFLQFGNASSSAALPLGQGVLFLWLVLGIAGMWTLLRVLGFSPRPPRDFPAEKLYMPSESAQPPPVLRSILRPWLWAACGSCLLLAAMDYRGVALNMFDTVVVPLPKAARDNEQLQGEMERMQALRQQARKGQVELKSYFEFRQQFFQQLPAGLLSASH